MALASLAAMRSIDVVLHMGKLTNARSAPSVNIETFSTWKPMLTDFLRTTWDKLKCLAIALITVVLNSAIFKERFFMEFEKVTTEAS